MEVIELSSDDENTTKQQPTPLSTTTIASDPKTSLTKLASLFTNGNLFSPHFANFLATKLYGEVDARKQQEEKKKTISNWLPLINPPTHRATTTTNVSGKRTQDTLNFELVKRKLNELSQRDETSSLISNQRRVLSNKSGNTSKLEQKKEELVVVPSYCSESCNSPVLISDDENSIAQLTSNSILVPDENIEDILSTGGETPTIQSEDDEEDEYFSYSPVSISKRKSSSENQTTDSETKDLIMKYSQQYNGPKKISEVLNQNHSLDIPSEVVRMILHGVDCGDNNSPALPITSEIQHKMFHYLRNNCRLRLVDISRLLSINDQITLTPRAIGKNLSGFFFNINLLINPPLRPSQPQGFYDEEPQRKKLANLIQNDFHNSSNRDVLIYISA